MSASASCLACLAKPGGQLGLPAARQLLERAHVQVAVVEVGFQARHAARQEAAVLADGVAAHGRHPGRHVLARGRRASRPPPRASLSVEARTRSVSPERAWVALFQLSMPSSTASLWCTTRTGPSATTVAGSGSVTTSATSRMRVGLGPQPAHLHVDPDQMGAVLCHNFSGIFQTAILSYRQYPRAACSPLTRHPLPMNTFAVVFLAALLSRSPCGCGSRAATSRHIQAHRAAVPAEFAGEITLEAHQKAADYSTARTGFSAAARRVRRRSCCWC